MNPNDHYFRHEIESLAHYAQSQLCELSQTLLLNILFENVILFVLIALIVLGGAILTVGRRSPSGRTGNICQGNVARQMHAPNMGDPRILLPYSAEFRQHISELDRLARASRFISEFADKFDPSELTTRN